jgi:hypothetical protein
VELYLGVGATGASCLVSSGSTWGYDPTKLVRIRTHAITRMVLISLECAASPLGDRLDAAAVLSYAPGFIHFHVSRADIAKSSDRTSHVVC